MTKQNTILASFIVGATAGFALAYFLVAGGVDVTTSKYSNLEENLITLEEDVDFYQNISYYAALLDEDSRNKLSDVVNTLDDDEEGGLQDILTLVYVSELYKNKDVKDSIMALKERVEREKEANMISDDKLFDKNTSCAGLVPGINQQLEVEEKLEFIFYSPSKNACLYSTHYSYSDYTGDYYSYQEKRIHNASSNSQEGVYKVSYYDYPGISQDEANKRSKSASVEYVKFILEASNYNTDLLEDASYIYGSL